MEGSILDTIGVEIIGVMSAVSICMLLVVLIVCSLYPSNPFSSAAAAPPLPIFVTLGYTETSSDSTAKKLEGALLNSLVFVTMIAVVTFLIVLLYYYKCTNFLKYYMRFSTFTVLGAMGGPIVLSMIQHFSIPVDSITCFVLLLNFTIVGVVSVNSSGIPIIVRQAYLVALGIIVAAWFTKIPEWTTWALLVALAVYDLVAVLAPRGPLKLLLELAQSRSDDLPALFYEARATVSQNTGNQGRSLERLLGGVSESGLVEMQTVSRNNLDQNESSENRVNSGHSAVDARNFENADGEQGRDLVERISLVGFSQESHSSSSRSSEYSTEVGNHESEIVMDEEMSPLVEMQRLQSETQRLENEIQQLRNALDSEASIRGGIKLGLGDFVFYSVLVGRAAMYDLMTVYACYLAIISGLGCTLILLSVCHQALPALPISITLGVIFYFLTRLLMEPFVVGTSTNLMMF